MPNNHHHLHPLQLNEGLSGSTHSLVHTALHMQCSFRLRLNPSVLSLSLSQVSSLNYVPDAIINPYSVVAESHPFTTPRPISPTREANPCSTPPGTAYVPTG